MIDESKNIIKQDKITLCKVVNKVRYLSNNEYDGNVYENILLIFNQLSIRERTILLRGLISFCFIVEDQLTLTDKDKETNEHITTLKKTNSKQDETIVESEIQDLNTINALELIKLKSWFFRTMIWVLVACIISFIAFNIIVNDGTTPAFPFFNDIFSIVKVIFSITDK